MRNYYATIVTFLFFFQFLNSYGQQEFKNKKIDSLFNSYTHKPREVVYTHLNKSTFIVGEDIGFTAYLYNKKDKKLSLVSKNLYIVIEDSKKNIIKEELLQVKNGVANSAITIDSIFTSGNYKFFAYTNWMKNFKEQNYFAVTINIIDPKVEKVIKKKIISSKIDAQFLPESGHLLSNVKNTIGVILKNELGYGISTAKGKLVDENNTIITTFKVNKLGITNFSFTPNIDKKYSVKITYNNTRHTFNLEKSEVKGIVFSVEKLPVGVNIKLKTNSFTIENVKNKAYKLVHHNGIKLNIFPVSFVNDLHINQFINPSKLFKGINVFTLFNNDNKPIAERVFFNYNDIKLKKSTNISVKKTQDSLQINLFFNKVLSSKINNISISVLPRATKTYKKHHNIASYILLKPYLKGTIENANYYFSDINNNTKKDLDNLLITQGWSSYDWYTIFNTSLKTNFFIEEGISAKAKVKNVKKSKYVIHPVGKGKPNYYVLEKEDTDFLALNLFPTLNQKLRLSYIDEKGNLKGTKAYIKFSPSSIPTLNANHKTLKPKLAFSMNFSKENNTSLLSLNKTQELDEIIIKSKINETRIETIKRRSFGKIRFFSDIDRKRNISFQDYIRNKGYGVIIEKGRMTIKKNSEANTVNAGNTPTIYLNGMQLFDFSDLAALDMTEVDYIDINKNGVGEGIRGGAGGVIRIRTNTNLQYTKKELKSFKKFTFPLVFTETKKYYAPKYKNYNNSFFKEYGVIDWLPRNTLNKNGILSFKIDNITSFDLKIFIEGITTDGQFISEEKILVLNSL